jgi:hypothetical protein
MAGTIAGATALLQLQVRSGQLPIPARLQQRKMTTNGCSLCGAAAQATDEHHIFVTCPAVQSHLANHKAQLEQRLPEGLDIRSRNRALENFSLCTTDGPQWLGHFSAYYMGRVPEQLRQRYIVKQDPLIMSILTSQCLVLAAHIWSIHKSTLWKANRR